MKYLLVAAVLAASLALVPSGLAKPSSNCHKTKSCAATPDPSFTCDGTTCTYFADGLTPGETVSARFEWTGFGGAGCDTGYGTATVSASGSYTLIDDEVALLGCGDPAAVSSGSMHAWLATAATPWDAPIVAGTEITVSVG